MPWFCSFKSAFYFLALSAHTDRWPGGVCVCSCLFPDQLHVCSTPIVLGSYKQTEQQAKRDQQTEDNKRSVSNEASFRRKVVLTTTSVTRGNDWLREPSGSIYKGRHPIEQSGLIDTYGWGGLWHFFKTFHNSWPLAATCLCRLLQPLKQQAARELGIALSRRALT